MGIKANFKKFQKERQCILFMSLRACKIPLKRYKDHKAKQIKKSTTLKFKHQDKGLSNRMYKRFLQV